jgi:tetratricopeptide (TPR) repeat protein
MDQNQTNWIRKRHTTFILALLVAAASLYVALHKQYRLGAFNDDALYVITASDLSNQTIRNIFPYIKPDFPLPGLPLILAPAAQFLAPDWTRLEWLSFGTALLNIFLLSLVLRKWLTPPETILACALYAVNPTVARFSGIIMPEPYYATCLMSSLLIMRHLLKTPTRVKAAAFGVLVGWASLMRLEGVLVLISLTAALFFYGRKRVFPGTVIASLFAWVLVALAWTQLRDLARVEYAGELASLARYWKHNPGEILIFTNEMVRVFINTFTAHTFSVGGTLTFLFTACTLAAAYGARNLWSQQVDIRPELAAIGLLTALYVPTYLFWHLIVPRYYLPLLPFALALFVHGLTRLSQDVTRRKAWSAALFALLFINYVPANGIAVHEAIWSRDPMKRPPWHTFEWIRENTPGNARFLSMMAPSIALYTDRFSTSVITPARNVEELRFNLLKRNLNYLVDRKVNALTPGVGKTENPNLTWKRLRLWIKAHPDEFERVFVDQKERVTIYAVKPNDRFIDAYEKYIAAVRAYQAGDMSTAFTLTNTSITLYPNLGAALNLLGVLYIAREDPENAEHFLMRALEQRPHSIFIRFNLATLCHMKKQDTRALDYLHEGLRVSQAAGEEERFLANLENYKSVWTPTSGGLFIDTPSI